MNNSDKWFDHADIKEKRSEIEKLMDKLAKEYAQYVALYPKSDVSKSAFGSKSKSDLFRSTIQIESSSEADVSKIGSCSNSNSKFDSSIIIIPDSELEVDGLTEAPHQARFNLNIPLSKSKAVKVNGKLVDLSTISDHDHLTNIAKGLETQVNMLLLESLKKGFERTNAGFAGKYAHLMKNFDSVSFCAISLLLTILFRFVISWKQMQIMPICSKTLQTKS